MAKAVLPDDQAKLTYIIVNKKINTKFISSPSPANPSMNDSSGLTPDHLYKLTYMLCQLYYNDRAQYAHKRAFLVGKGFH